MIPIPPTLEGGSLAPSVARFTPSVTLNYLRVLCDGDEVLVELLDAVLSGALRYAESVCCFQQIVLKQGQSFDQQGEREQIEKVRGSSHDAFITDVNVLIRTMRKSGKDVSWGDALGNDRSRYGRLSLTLSFEIIQQQKVS